MKFDVRFIANRPAAFPALYRGDISGDIYLFVAENRGVRISWGVNSPKHPLGDIVATLDGYTRLSVDQELVLRNST